MRDRRPPGCRGAVLAGWTLSFSLLALGSCASITRVPTFPAVAASLAEPGPLAFRVEAGQRSGRFGRTVAYEAYRPTEERSQVMVFLAHGFRRDLSNMRGWAAHWASHGVPVVVMSLPNSTWFNGRHERNAADLVALAAALHDGPVLYGGFSTGGLASYLAAARDPRTRAYLGLDAVDSGGLAVRTRPDLTCPAMFLLGDPSRCNARNNMREAIPGAAAAFRVLGSTHCHFENPYDPRCERVCGSVEPPEAAAEILRTIRSLATAWVLDRCGGHAQAEAALAAVGAGQWSGRLQTP